jgi:extradiol dioxygenase family protein
MRRRGRRFEIAALPRPRTLTWGRVHARREVQDRALATKAARFGAELATPGTAWRGVSHPSLQRRGTAVSAKGVSLPPFHLAFPVHDLAAARRFYGDLLGCPEGRSSSAWVDFDFYGHQIVAHLAPDEAGHHTTSAVDGDAVPVRHFGAVLDLEIWRALAGRLVRAGVRFIIEPHVRFEGEVGEQSTMFFLDPSGNAIEFKAFADPSRLFAK